MIKATKKSVSTPAKSRISKPSTPLLKPDEFPKAVRLVKRGSVIAIELYFDKRQALAAGVKRRIADAVFDDVKVALCYPSPLPPNLIGCKSRSAPDNCDWKCVLYGDGEEIGTGYHLFNKDVLYTCKCE